MHPCYDQCTALHGMHGYGGEPGAYARLAPKAVQGLPTHLPNATSTHSSMSCSPVSTLIPKTHPV